MKKTAISLIGCFFAVAFFATAQGSEHEYREGHESYEYHNGHERYDDDRNEYRGGSGGHYDDDRYEYRSGSERYDDDRHEYRGGHESNEYRGSERYNSDDRYEYRRYAYDK